MAGAANRAKPLYHTNYASTELNVTHLVVVVGNTTGQHSFIACQKIRRDDVDPANVGFVYAPDPNFHAMRNIFYKFSLWFCHWYICPMQRVGPFLNSNFKAFDVRESNNKRKLTG